MIFSASSMENR